MIDTYRTIRQEGRDEYVVSRSRFIGWSKPISAEEEALAFIEQIRKMHRDASHNVWAYAFGSDRERFSDDGEPQGTAGIPVLEVIRKEALHNVAVVVTRYFGGVKLGASGLVRAYTHSAKAALDAGVLIERRPFLSFQILADYAFAEKLRRAFPRQGYTLQNTEYRDQVSLTVLIPPGEELALRALAAEVTAGQAQVLQGPDAFQDFLLHDGADAPPDA